MATARAISRLSPTSSILMVCDMQEGFRKTIKYFPEIIVTQKRLIEAARLLNMQMIVTEQYPKGLGYTVPELDIDPKVQLIHDKTKFSMCVPSVLPLLSNIKSVILVGIEAHACVLQTSYDLLEQGLNVHVVVDATSSRSLTDRKFAFKQMERAGAVLTTSECVILELLRDAKHPQFRAVQKLILESAPDTGLVHNNKL